ncbi:MAG: 2-phosphosulfolactate phosphatase [Hyphomicrobiaceae bacterium]
MPAVVIDALPSCAAGYVDDWTIVVVDVIRFTTTATTALSMGRKAYPARSSDQAFALAAKLPSPLLAGELGGNIPYGFDMTNSPVAVASLGQVPCGNFTSPERPLVLVSSSGSQLLLNSAYAKDVYLGCLRNLTALTEYLAPRHDKIAVLGAGTRGAFRREDQLCCAWIAERLHNKGFEFENQKTSDLVDRWHGESPSVIRDGRSADYLKRTGQVHDLEFVLHYREDLMVVPRLAEEGYLKDAAADAFFAVSRSMPDQPKLREIVSNTNIPIKPQRVCR